MFKSRSKPSSMNLVTFSSGIEITVLHDLKVVILYTPDPLVTDATYFELEQWLKKQGFFLQVLAPETSNASIQN